MDAMLPVLETESVPATGNVNENGYSRKLTPYLILCCMVAASGGIIFGYDLGISGGVSSMSPFVEKFFPGVYMKMQGAKETSNYCKFDSQLLTAFLSSLYATGLVASLVASPITRSYGRKKSMIIGGTAFFSGAVVSGAASNIAMLIVGRVLLGIGIGFTNQAVPLYLSEMAPPWYRGAISNGFEFCVSLGVVFANSINYGTQNIHGDWGWRISLASASVPAFVLTVGTGFLPDTPNSIIQRSGDVQTSIKILQKTRGMTDIQNEIEDLVATVSASRSTGTISKQHSFRKILKRKHRPQLVFAIALPFFQQMMGADFVGFYAPVLFRSIGLRENAALLYAVMIALASLVFKVLAMLVVDKVGRRTLFFVGGLLAFVPLVVIAVIMKEQLDDVGEMGKIYAFTVLVLLCVALGGFSLSWGPLTWLVASEIFPLEIRSAGQSIVVAIALLMKFANAQSSLAMLCHLKYGIFFLFSGCVVIMTLFIYLFLPETKRVPLEKMDEIWDEDWFWQKVVSKQQRQHSITRIQNVEIEL